ncbi:hypothetical protein M0R01_04645 [bacterium]|jgi:hypothetical protein|nr:hypothetical protein [bacterium]
MTTELYYTPPTEEIFNEVKQKAIEIWKTYEDGTPYSKEKIDRIKDIKNVQDNLMYIVAMFDISNQRLLSKIISPEARQAIRERMIEGGMPEELIYF